MSFKVPQTASAFGFGGKRAGIIGKPSDWLISSDTDPAKVKNKLNVELVDIPIAELIDEVREYDGDPRSFEGSEEIYRVLKKIILKYDLQALTIRCFDLLDTLHNTGCLALARLNAEGFPASCEGDIPALLTMMMAQQKTGCSGFQSNLSRIEGDNLLFAHCTVPLNMVVSFKYDTHFESGLGTAVKGVLPEGPVTIMKVSPDLESMAVIPGEITANTSEQMLCRTQVIVHATGARDYFLHAPLANHHVIVPGLVF